jgi:hypothetical protein
MKVQVNLDESTMNVSEEHHKEAIQVTVRLARHDIRDGAIRDRMSKLWVDLEPLKHLIEHIVLETTESNISFIAPFAWLCPIPLTPVPLVTVATQ